MKETLQKNTGAITGFIVGVRIEKQPKASERALLGARYLEALYSIRVLRLEDLRDLCYSSTLQC